MWKSKIGEQVRGGFLYDGIKMAQHHEAPQQLFDLLSELKPTVIVEIGTLCGGLTMFIQDVMPAGCRLVTLDIRDVRGVAARRDGYEFAMLDCFSDDGLAKIKELIASGSPTLVLCDGGDKPKEVNTFAEFLKPGDVIMAHDYHKDKAAYDQIGKYCWQWWEIKLADVADTVQARGLVPYREDALTPVAWCCFKKQ